MQSPRAASEEDDNSPQKRANSRSQDRPGSRPILRVGVGVVVVDIRPDDAEEHKVDDHDDHGGQESQEGDDGGEERTDHARAQGEDEGDEVQAAGDRVEDHGLG